MKKIFIIVAILSFAIVSNAQDKKLDNVKKLFDSQSFTECIEVAKKYNASNSTKPDGYFYLGFSYYGLYKQNPQKESQLTTTENTIYQAITKDKSGDVRVGFSDKLDDLHSTMAELQTKYFESGDKTKAGQHSSMLAKIFKDTTEVYRRIYEPEKFVQPTGKILAAYEGPSNQLDVTGKKIGVWIEKYPNGFRKSQINFENGKPRGDFYKFYPKGGINAHLYFYDDSLASAILYAENGDKVAMGYYYNHQKDSLWQYYEADSVVISEENYHHGVKNGKETTFFVFGFPVEELNWKDGKKDGVWKRYYESSTVDFETVYKNGALNGPYKKYDIKGNVIVSGTYKDDLKDGVWTMHDIDSNKTTTIKYINGHPENEKELDAEQTKKLEEYMNRKGEFRDPQNYRNDPDAFLGRSSYDN